MPNCLFLSAASSLRENRRKALWHLRKFRRLNVYRPEITSYPPDVVPLYQRHHQKQAHNYNDECAPVREPFIAEDDAAREECESSCGVHKLFLEECAARHGGRG